MSNTVQLNFINKSNDSNNSNVVICIRRFNSGLSGNVLAWTVIKNCGQGWHHKFVFPQEVKIGAADAWGNDISAPIAAEDGSLYQVFRDKSGDQLSFFGPASSSKEIQIKNNLEEGSITAKIYRDNKLFCIKEGISPAQTASFAFDSNIWIGVVSQAEEGEFIDEDIVSDINTEINLLGIKSADIVMKGGGTGETATPFEFVLENIVYNENA